MTSIACAASTLLVLSLAITSCSNSIHPSNAANGTQAVSNRSEQTTPEQSIYQIEGLWSNQDNTSISLADLKGKVQVVAMIFTRCQYSCSQITAKMRAMQQQIPPDRQDDVGFVLVSFDADRDTPDKLKAFARTMNIDDRWTLLHGDEQQVRELSALLGVKYAKQPNGDFAHSNLITVLDAEGVIATKLEGLNIDPKESVQAINSLLD
jgi:protein SCO1/2